MGERSPSPSELGEDLARRPLHHQPEEGGWSPSPSELGEDFGTVATRLAGWCGVALGWSPDAFWRATPAEVAAIVAAMMPAQGAAPVTGAMLAGLEERCDG